MIVAIFVITLVATSGLAMAQGWGRGEGMGPGYGPGDRWPRWMGCCPELESGAESEDADAAGEPLQRDHPFTE